MFWSIAVYLLFSPRYASCGAYLDSAHGSSSFGVDRSSTDALGYAQGNCAHCHEQHASIAGSEPAPAGGAKPFLLFCPNMQHQTEGACFKCHVDTGSFQEGVGLNNYSYSYRAGGWTSDPVDDVLEAFSFTAPSSSHNLSDIVTFIDGKWGYTAASNPCVACHDPHAAQGDPANSSAVKSSGARGWPVSRPSEHSVSPWNLWGDDYTAPGSGNGERMNNYTSNYQAPYRFEGSPDAYEPDGTTTTDGSNLTDFNSLCTDCHNATNVIESTNLGRPLRTIDWDNEKHGKGDADSSLCGDNPYPAGATGLGKVLSCLDCHEPHGSANAFLIRKEVNGGVLGGSIDSFATTDWHYLCDRCHQDDKEINGGCQEDHYYQIHHVSTGCNDERPYSPTSCAACHSASPGSGCGSGKNKKVCTECHFHGSSAASRVTF